MRKIFSSSENENSRLKAPSLLRTKARNCTICFCFNELLNAYLFCFSSNAKIGFILNICILEIRYVYDIYTRNPITEEKQMFILKMTAL